MIIFVISLLCNLIASNFDCKNALCHKIKVPSVVTINTIKERFKNNKFDIYHHRREVKSAILSHSRLFESMFFKVTIAGILNENFTFFVKTTQKLFVGVNKRVKKILILLFIIIGEEGGLGPSSGDWQMSNIFLKPSFGETFRVK